jgi:hypothetical protein
MPLIMLITPLASNQMVISTAKVATVIPGQTNAMIPKSTETTPRVITRNLRVSNPESSLEAFITSPPLINNLMIKQQIRFVNAILTYSVSV